jgi:hypothetical protein
MLVGYNLLLLRHLRPNVIFIKVLYYNRCHDNAVKGSF